MEGLYVLLLILDHYKQYPLIEELSEKVTWSNIWYNPTRNPHTVGWVRYSTRHLCANENDHVVWRYAYTTYVLYFSIIINYGKTAKKVGGVILKAKIRFVPDNVYLLVWLFPSFNFYFYTGPILWIRSLFYVTMKRWIRSLFNSTVGWADAKKPNNYWINIVGLRSSAPTYTIVVSFEKQAKSGGVSFINLMNNRYELIISVFSYL